MYLSFQNGPQNNENSTSHALTAGSMTEKSSNRRSLTPLFEELRGRLDHESFSPPRRRMSAGLCRELSEKVRSIQMSRGNQKNGMAEEDFHRQVKNRRSFAERCDNLERKMQDRLLKGEPNEKGVVKSCTDSLYNAVSTLDWSTALRLVRNNPELAQYIDPHSGFGPLHMACGRGSTPLILVEALVEAHPQAVNTRTPFRRYFDTPLHIQARNSQASSSKVMALLPHADVRMTNRLGHTALHTACGNNAIIDVIRALIDKDQNLLDVEDVNGRSPLHVLWEGYMQSIPGHLTTARILMGREIQLSQSFKRFWAKVELLVSRGRREQDDFQLGHAMVECRAKASMLQLALRLDPDLALHPDEHGNFLLHHMIACRWEYFEPLIDLLTMNQESCSACNMNGDTILSLAIKKNLMSYIPCIIRAAPALVTTLDRETQLYPFQLAASCGLPLDILYLLFLESPDVIDY